MKRFVARAGDVEKWTKTGGEYKRDIELIFPLTTKYMLFNERKLISVELSYDLFRGFCYWEFLTMNLCLSRVFGGMCG